MSKLILSESEKKEILSMYGLITETQVFFEINKGTIKEYLKIFPVDDSWFGILVRNNPTSPPPTIIPEDAIKVPKLSEIGFIYKGKSEDGDLSSSFTPNSAAIDAINLGAKVISNQKDLPDIDGKRYVFHDDTNNKIIMAIISLREYPVIGSGNEVKLEPGVEIFCSGPDYFRFKCQRKIPNVKEKSAKNSCIRKFVHSDAIEAT